MEQKVQGDSYWKRRHILFDKYRVVVGGIGIVYEGDSVSEAKRQFTLFARKSKTAESSSAGELVTLFKNYEIINEYHLLIVNEIFDKPATPQQQQHLKTLPPYKVTVVQRNGKTYYVYADPAHSEIYVGSQFQYYRYRDLRLEKNLAQEDLQTSELNAETAMGWDVWGPGILKTTS